jgi:hypothetical protein
VPEQEEGPLGHVLRAALPWRDRPPLTECGKDPAPGMPAMSLEEFAAKVRAQGKQRSALTTCMTCWATAARHQATTWAASPVAVIAREASWAAAGYWLPGAVRDDPVARLFRDELLAVAELVSRHRAEFDGIVSGLAGAARLDDARRRRRGRAS